MTKSAIERATEIVGGQSALARILGCTPQAISKMCATGRVPAERVLAIEWATHGKVTRHQLRPDLYPFGNPPRLRTSPSAPQEGVRGEPSDPGVVTA